MTRIEQLLTEIRDELRKLNLPIEFSCEHQEAKRIDLSTLRETNWKCGECGYHHRVSHTAAS